MEYIIQGVQSAVRMIVSLDRDFVSAVTVSLKVTTSATILAAVAGIPLGVAIALREFTGKRPLVVLVNTLMAMPTVVLGLLFYSLLSRRGPLGALGFLYTQWAMVIGQFALILPIVSALSISAVQSTDIRVSRTALALGASPWQTCFLILGEARRPILAAVVASFGRAFGEVGISMMLGGNIRGYTRNITTAIALETSKGEFGLAFSLGIVLLAIAFAVNLLLHHIRKTAWSTRWQNQY